MKKARRCNTKESPRAREFYKFLGFLPNGYRQDGAAVLAKSGSNPTHFSLYSTPDILYILKHAARVRSGPAEYNMWCKIHDLHAPAHSRGTAVPQLPLYEDRYRTTAWR